MSSVEKCHEAGRAWRGCAQRLTVDLPHRFFVMVGEEMMTTIEKTWSNEGHEVDDDDDDDDDDAKTTMETNKKMKKMMMTRV